MTDTNENQNQNGEKDVKMDDVKSNQGGKGVDV